MGRGDTTGDIRNGAGGIDKGDLKVMKEEKVGNIVDKVPVVELETGENEALSSYDADKLEGLHTQSQSPDKQDIKEIIDNGDIKLMEKETVENIMDKISVGELETDENGEVHTYSYEKHLAKSEVILEALSSDDADNLEGVHTQSQSPEKQEDNEIIDIGDIKAKEKEAVEDIEDNDMSVDELETDDNNKFLTYHSI